MKPRKAPVQARSAFTVESIFAATIQVLLSDGLSRLTTTRIAQRAGVSVGTLYQYFPNREALLASVLRSHLELVLHEVTAACVAARGQPLDVMATAVVDAFIRAKLADAPASRALYAVAPEVQGNALVSEVMQRARAALCELLATASGCRFEELPIVASVCASAMVGPVQALMEMPEPYAEADKVREHLRRMIAAYLVSVAGPLTDADAIAAADDADAGGAH